MQIKFNFFETEKSAFLFLLAVSLFFYLGHAPVIVWDMAWYLSRAVNILHGIGYVGPDQTLDADGMMRGPVFPALLAIGLWFDESASGAFWIVRLFSIAMPLLIYLFCLRLFKPILPQQGNLYIYAAALSSLSYMGCWAIHFSVMRHIDVVLPFFLLAGLYVFLNVSDTHKTAAQKLISAFFAGALLGTAYLTKEAAILFLIAPLLWWLIVPEARTKPVFLYAMVALVTTCSLIGLWIFYVYEMTGHAPLLGKVGGWAFGTEEQGATSSVFAYGARFFNALALMFYGQPTSLFNAIPVSILFPFSWLYIAILAWKKYPRYRFLLALFILNLPLVLFNSEQGWRVGNNLFFYIFCFMIFALSIFHFVMDSRFIQKKKVLKIACLIVVLLGFIPNAQGRTLLNFLSGSLWAQAIGVKDKNIRGFNYASLHNHQIFIDYFKTADDSRGIVADHPAFANALYFLLGTNHKTYPIAGSMCFDLGIAGESYFGPFSPQDKLLFFDVKLHNTLPYPVITLFEQHLLAQLSADDIGYIAFYNYYAGLQDYFESHPAFEKVAEQETPYHALWKIDQTKLKPLARPFTARIPDMARRAIDDALARQDNKMEIMYRGLQNCYGTDFKRDWFINFYNQKIQQ